MRIVFESMKTLLGIFVLFFLTIVFSVDDQTLIQNFESNTDWVLPVLSDCLLVGNMNIDKYCFYPFLELTKKYELKLGKEVCLVSFSIVLLLEEVN